MLSWELGRKGSRSEPWEGGQPFKGKPAGRLYIQAGKGEGMGQCRPLCSTEPGGFWELRRTARPQGKGSAETREIQALGNTGHWFLRAPTGGALASSVQKGGERAEEPWPPQKL